VAIATATATATSTPAGNHGHNGNFNGQFRGTATTSPVQRQLRRQLQPPQLQFIFSHVNRSFGVVGVPSYNVNVGVGVPMVGYGVTQSFGVPATGYQTQTFSSHTFGGGFAADPNCVVPVAPAQTFGLPVAPVTPVVPVVPVYPTRPGLLNRFSGALNGFGRGY
jgi:hypothetical protein